MTISVIIPTCDDDLRLQWALEALCAQSVSPLEVIVVNDGGGKATSDLVRSFESRLPIAHLYASPSSPDFRAALARNEGARYSMGELLVFMDCDCVLPPDGLKAHFGNQWRNWLGQQQPYRVGVGSRRYLLESRVRSFEPPFDFSGLWNQAVEIADTPCPTDVVFRSFNLSVPAALFCELGGFDETFTGWGGEDSEFFWRMVRWGIEPGNRVVEIAPLPQAIHLNHPQRGAHQPRNTDADIAARINEPITANGGPLVRF